jgi:hypothetical protein
MHLRNSVEANLLEAILREAGVPHFIKVYRDAGFNGSWHFVDAWGQVECAAEDEAQVREILDGIRKQAH